MKTDKILHQTKSGWKVVLVTNITNMLTTNGNTTPPAPFTERMCYIQIWDERKTGAGHSQEPFLCDDGRVLYDYPQMPKAFKRRVVRLMRQYKHLTY